MTRKTNSDPLRRCRRSASMMAASGLFLIGSVQAQTLDAPASVCPDEEFEVAWTGPAAEGDRITVAESVFPADQFISSHSTADGTPAGLRAPARQGFFEVRYVQAAPEDILLRRGIRVRNCASIDTSTGTGSGAGSPGQPGTGSPGQPGAGSSGGSGGTVPVIGVNQAVLVSGIATNYGDVVNREGPYGNFEGTIEALCDNSGTIGWALREMIGAMEQAAYDEGLPISFDRFESTFPEAPSRAGIADDLSTVRDEVCDLEEKPPEVQPFVITYAYCRMAMMTPGQVMDIHLPPTIGTGTMTAADFVEGEAIQMTLQRSFDAAAAVVGPGWSSQVAMTSPTSGGLRIGYPTTRYAFEYSGGLGGGGMVPFANMVSTETSGTVWVSQDVPGYDIIRSFYENLTAEVSPDQGGTSFFSGLINNLVGMLRNGLPLEGDQTVSAKVMGRTTISGRSHTIVTGIRVIDFEPGFCERSLLPAGMPVRDIDQEISEAMSSSGVSSQELNDTMQQYNDAMQNMTPEQKQMMEQFGMGDMLQNMMGGPNPGAQQAAGAGTGAGAGATAASGNSGSNMPPSSDLQSGDLTESAQRQLRALGYDPGNTVGDMTTATIVAISQFQAENGLDVTGEVTPQLVGILAAAVDKRN